MILIVQSRGVFVILLVIQIKLPSIFVALTNPSILLNLFPGVISVLLDSAIHFCRKHLLSIDFSRPCRIQLLLLLLSLTLLFNLDLESLFVRLLRKGRIQTLEKQNAEYADYC